MFENIRQNVARPVDEMLNGLEARLQAGKFEKDPLNAVLEIVARGLVEFKNKNVDVAVMSVQDIADLSNAWKAWERGGIFAGEEHKKLRVELQNLLQDKPECKFARQIWRTDVVSYLIEKLVSSDRRDKLEIMEKIMESQIVAEKDRETIKVLTGAMYLEGAIRDKAGRVAMAEKMKNSSISGELKDIKTLFGSNYQVEELKVVTGGAFLDIPLELGSNFVFEKMVLDGDRIYAQMKNGCKGNLVMIKVGLAEDQNPPLPEEEEEEQESSERPLTEDDVVRELQKFKHTQYRAVEKAYFGSRGFVRKIFGWPDKISAMDVEPAAETIDPNGNKLTGKLLYVYKNSAGKNPPFYLIVDQASIGGMKIRLLRGDIQYSSRYLGISQSADYQPPNKEYEIDFSSAAARDASLKAMFDVF